MGPMQASRGGFDRANVRRAINSVDTIRRKIVSRLNNGSKIQSRCGSFSPFDPSDSFVLMDKVM
jgi:hypothetical protein